ncbi:hypothetical protein OPV22_004755 [Ensete ventricosum]|uniref:Uncharacterized protein n=1 Tax=Ensete ventricosum TaxID=4639 RepID=A0AAV8RPK8_ENSVE|nr:hypothetical protein OPV22_004755 [Ensete ventricosum]
MEALVVCFPFHGFLVNSFLTQLGQANFWWLNYSILHNSGIFKDESNPNGSSQAAKFPLKNHDLGCRM